MLSYQKHTDDYEVTCICFFSQIIFVIKYVAFCVS